MKISIDLLICSLPFQMHTVHVFTFLVACFSFALSLFLFFWPKIEITYDKDDSSSIISFLIRKVKSTW